VPFGKELLKSPRRGPVAPHVVVVVIETGEDGSPRRATYRVADEGILEGGALFDQ
jgi:hypothetical protein